jgi:hypothetical protein
MTDRFVDTSPDLPGLPRLPRVSRGIARVIPTTGFGRGGLGLPVLTAGEEQPRNYPPVPDGFDGSPEEWAVWWAHGVLGRGEEGELWSFKTPLLGDISVTGFAADFSEYEERVAIDVVNINASEEQQAGTRAAAIIRRAVLARFAYQYIVIESEDALEDPVAMLQDALIGIDHSRFLG